MFLAKNVTSQTFFNVSESAGISHAHISANLFGGGVAILDYNNDGFEDIFLTGGIRDDKLYKNKGDGTFEDVSLMAGVILTETVKTSGAVAGDINNDGFEDIFVTTESSHRNLLYINNGDGTFSEISDEAGIKSNVWSTGAALADYNGDGLLDIYVINYIKENRLIRDENNDVTGFEHDCYNNHFYINNGDGTFEESAEILNINDDGCGLAIAFTDYNLDNKIDLYIANDFGAWIKPNTLYENKYPSNSFEDKSEASGLNCEVYGMGIAVGDINNDGKFDYYVTNIGRNVLFKNNTGSTFEDITELADVANVFAGDLLATSWGANFFDYDLDGFEDLFVANGHMPSADFLKNSEEDPNKLYRNMGDETFEDQSEIEGVADQGISRGSATFDYDNDGDLDLIVTNLSRSSNTTVNTLIYNNQQASQNHWVKFKLAGTISNKSAIGSKVIVHRNGKLKIRELSGGASHASNNSSYLHFGLGTESTIDSLTVLWPSGEKNTFYTPEVDQSYYIAEGSNQLQVMGCTQSDNALYNPNATYNTACLPEVEHITSLHDQREITFSIYPNPFTDQATVRFSNESVYGPVSIIIVDTQGRIVRQFDHVQQNYTILKNEIASGCYWYKAFDAKGRIADGLLIIK